MFVYKFYAFFLQSSFYVFFLSLYFEEKNILWKKTYLIWGNILKSFSRFRPIFARFRPIFARLRPIFARFWPIFDLKSYKMTLGGEWVDKDESCGLKILPSVWHKMSIYVDCT